MFKHKTDVETPKPLIFVSMKDAIVVFSLHVGYGFILIYISITHPSNDIRELNAFHEQCSR